MKKLLFIIATLVLVGCQPLQQMRQDEILVAVGYASVSEQTGRTTEEKRVRAMRASKIDAYRELAEQVYGMRVSGRAELADQRLGVVSTTGAVDGCDSRCRGGSQLSSGRQLCDRATLGYP